MCLYDRLAELTLGLSNNGENGRLLKPTNSIIPIPEKIKGNLS